MNYFKSEKEQQKREKLTFYEKGTVLQVNAIDRNRQSDERSQFHKTSFEISYH